MTKALAGSIVKKDSCGTIIVDAATFDRGLAFAVQEVKDKAALAKKHNNKYFKSDEAIDLKVKEYKGFKLGQVVYREGMFDYNDYDPVMVVGFTKLLLKGNPFSDPETRKNGIRRVIIAYTYISSDKRPKTIFECHSHPAKSLKVKPVQEKVPVCVYCKKRPQEKCNQGACRSYKCRFLAMRDSM